MAEKVGRPRKFKSPEEMREVIDAYFDETPAEDVTVTGLALYLGFTSRKDLINYEGYGEEFYHAIKKAKLRVEHEYEKDLRKKGGSGPIFALKNFDWTDKQEHEVTSDAHLHFDRDLEGL